MCDMVSNQSAHIRCAPEYRDKLDRLAYQAKRSMKGHLEVLIDAEIERQSVKKRRAKDSR